MTEWFHCNICIVRYKSAIKFYITSCGHIVCQDCLVKTGFNNQCPKCKSRAELNAISEDMDSNLKAFLRPVSEFTNKLTQIISFQQTQATSFIKGTFNKYNMAKVEVVKGRVLNKKLRTENAKLATENAKLATENAKLTTENDAKSRQFKEMNKSQFSLATSKFDITNWRSTNSTMLKRNLAPYHFEGALTHPKPVLWGGMKKRRTVPLNLFNRSQDISYNLSSLKLDGSSFQNSRPAGRAVPICSL